MDIQPTPVIRQILFYYFIILRTVLSFLVY